MFCISVHFLPLNFFCFSGTIMVLELLIIQSQRLQCKLFWTLSCLFFFVEGKYAYDWNSVMKYNVDITSSNTIFINLKSMSKQRLFVAFRYLQNMFPRSKELSSILHECPQRSIPEADPPHMCLFTLLFNNEAMQIVFHAYALEHSISFQLYTRLLLRNSQFVLC